MQNIAFWENCSSGACYSTVRAEEFDYLAPRDDKSLIVTFEVFHDN